MANNPLASPTCLVSPLGFYTVTDHSKSSFSCFFAECLVFYQHIVSVHSSWLYSWKTGCSYLSVHSPFLPTPASPLCSHRQYTFIFITHLQTIAYAYIKSKAPEWEKTCIFSSESDFFILISWFPVASVFPKMMSFRSLWWMKKSPLCIYATFPSPFISRCPPNFQLS